MYLENIFGTYMIMNNIYWSCRTKCDMLLFCAKKITAKLRKNSALKQSENLVFVYRGR